MAKTFGELPYCWFGQRGTVYFVSSTEQFFYCDGRKYVELTMVGQAGPEGPRGAPGEDGMSCSVSDDGNGTVTIRCDDGTVAIVRDGAPGPAGPEGPQGPQGEPGEDGASCTIAANGDGTVDLSCGDDAVTITGGQDGSSCSAATDASGAVTIACDDGTSATIPAGGGEGGATVEFLCDLIEENELDRPFGLPCPSYCPCWRPTEILANAAVTGCFFERRVNGDPGRFRLFAFPLTSVPAHYYAELGGFGEESFECEAPGRVVRRSGDTLDRAIRNTSDFFGCRQVLQETAGPCLSTCDVDNDCRDLNDCTDDVCEGSGFCANLNSPTGSDCVILSSGEAGECFAGQCVPSLVIGVPGGAP